MKAYYSSHDICKYLNTTRTTLMNWVRAGKLPAYETLAGHYRVAHQDLINLMNERRIPIPEELESSKKRVLLVDDERSVIDSLELMIKDIGVGIETRSATNGIIAGLELLEFKPHLIVLDYRMPGADGDVLLKSIKERAALKDIKIIVYSGYPDEAQKMVEMGADKFIEKGSKESSIGSMQIEICRLLGIKIKKVSILENNKALK